jgi:glucose/mannose-6-phosphate isomerase
LLKLKSSKIKIKDMKTLDDKKILNKYSKSKVDQTISYLSAQLSESFSEAAEIKFPKSYKDVKNIVVAGMGGSNLATEMIRSIYGEDMKVPFVLVRNYSLPSFVNSKTLVIISSYSGNTEEIVNCLKEARAKKAKIFCIAGGGKIASGAKRYKLPFYRINKNHNPGNQPRYGVGSQFGATLAVLNTLKLLKVKTREISEASEYLYILDKALDANIPVAQNIAKNIAMELYGSMPIIVSAEFLSANGHVLNNQINESAKNLAAYFEIPELNHHLMEGLKLPTPLTNKIKFLFFGSNLYEERIAKRFNITQKVLKKQKIKFIDYEITGDSKLLAALEVLLLGSWVSYYMTILNKTNPVNIPYVDWFKKELVK